MCLLYGHMGLLCCHRYKMHYTNFKKCNLVPTDSTDSRVIAPSCVIASSSSSAAGGFIC